MVYSILQLYETSIYGIHFLYLRNKHRPVSSVRETYFHKHVVTRNLGHKYTITIYFHQSLDVTIYPRTFTSPYEIVKLKYTTIMIHMLKKIYITPTLNPWKHGNGETYGPLFNIVNDHWVKQIAWHLFWSIRRYRGSKMFFVH